MLAAVYHEWMKHCCGLSDVTILCRFSVVWVGYSLWDHLSPLGEIAHISELIHPSGSMQTGSECHSHLISSNFYISWSFLFKVIVYLNVEKAIKIDYRSGPFI